MASTSPRSRTGCYRHAPGLRMRALPELIERFDVAGMAYRPDEPRLFRLNPCAWTALELADGHQPGRRADLPGAGARAPDRGPTGAARVISGRTRRTTPALFGGSASASDVLEYGSGEARR